MAIHFQFEKFHLVLMRYLWVITYLFFIPSTCPAHNVTNFIDFDWFYLATFSSVITVFYIVVTMELEKMLRNGKWRSFWFLLLSQIQQ